jgi:hypothetical protein
MSLVQAEMAVVYRGGGRRFLTLKAACRAEAKRAIRCECRASGDDPAEISPVDFAAEVTTRAALHHAAFRRDMP